jgi:flagellar FliJ protein
MHHFLLMRHTLYVRHQSDARIIVQIQSLHKNLNHVTQTFDFPFVFRFRLQPLQKIRENVRQERQAELAKALEAETIVREKLESIQHEIAATKEDGRKFASGGAINVEFLIGLRRHEAFLLAQKADVENRLEQVLTEVARRRQAVVEADKDVKMMEKLHEVQKEKYDAAMVAKEIVNMDEIASQKRRRIT